ncbi:MAG: class I SAM-dependent methyltransferase [Phycisphaerales bacterium]|nr:class I SAM-dependent methyltransferase [Phycisphaerae bacterium]NNF42540.1 class I SAM-dependent methyltransferase [Phycisphaerales bacterium]NNM27501.1 class I SAM-dependent methyltransferase [Phycisphaerales bacterium]
MSIPVTAPPSIDPLDAVLEEMLRTKRAPGDDGRTIDVSEYAVPAGAAQVLEAAARSANAASMVEIGMASGISTLAICRGRKAAGPALPRSYHVIDPHQRHFADCGLVALERAGVRAMVDFHRAPAHLVLPRLLERDAAIGFAFVDGLHQMDNVISELYLLDMMLPIGGVVALHDMWMPGLQHAVSYWLANRAYEPVTTQDGAFVATPCESVKRGCGAPAARPAFFAERVVPYVDWSVLLMRKVAADERAWDFFRPYV